MHHRIYQSLRIFVHVAQYMNLSEAANAIHITKGALSYQIKQLEEQLGFEVFLRQNGGIVFSRKGQDLYQAMSNLFEQAEQQIKRITDDESSYLTVGMTTYFASRWLTPRLMRFTSAHPEIRLRIQPTMGTVDLQNENIDLAIQWGDGKWDGGATIEPLFFCPAFPTAGNKTVERIRKTSLEEQLANTPLLHDFEESTSWEKWFTRAGLQIPQQSHSLVIPDPNVRVEAVINEQGIALNDALVLSEIERGALLQISDLRLEEFGYFLMYPGNTVKTDAFNLFRTWLITEVVKPGSLKSS